MLDRCDQLVQGLEMAAMATAVYARIEPPDRRRLPARPLRQRGPPRPAGAHPDGELLRLDEQRSPMIGACRLRPAPPVAGHASARCAAAGLLLLLYTDGLTDVAGYDADARTALLERTVAAVPPGSDAETVVDDVLAACLPDPLRDDVALLAVRLNP